LLPFVKTFKRDYVCIGNLKDAKTVVAQLAMWFNDYNEKAPHKVTLPPKNNPFKNRSSCNNFNIKKGMNDEKIKIYRRANY